MQRHTKGSAGFRLHVVKEHVERRGLLIRLAPSFAVVASSLQILHRIPLAAPNGAAQGFLNENGRAALVHCRASAKPRRMVPTVEKKERNLMTSSDFEITPQMIEAGAEAILSQIGGADLGGFFSAPELAVLVYQAMSRVDCAASRLFAKQSSTARVRKRKTIQ